LNEMVSVYLGIAAARGIAKIKRPKKVLKGAIVVIGDWKVQLAELSFLPSPFILLGG